MQKFYQTSAFDFKYLKNFVVGPICNENDNAWKKNIFFQKNSMNG